ncbi:hypothetical protein BT63DRAFT_451628 [Microthyrium microscopicum]|uniref:Zn(2)-C6 fungal-type domain-containing protein n=1 Tax=Microthyrium microscopicum TaxID=703497 RepID=A0A6A6UMS5_9PEZI|nr:hypothetical protein BT63DRAFT_451628 [Microthyrium microscopicum]
MAHNHDLGAQMEDLGSPFARSRFRMNLLRSFLKTPQVEVLKCDDKRPTCDRCERYGTVCGGYEKDFRFVDETPKLAKRRFIEAPSGSEQPSSSEAESHIIHPDSPSGKSAVSFINHVDLKPMQAEICINYLYRTLLEPKSDSAQGSLWNMSDETTGAESLEQVAIKSLATTYFGRMHSNDTSLIDEGGRLYRRAIRQLAEKLAYPETSTDQEIMLTCLTLYHYEFIMNTNEFGWVRHAGGIGKLLERRGPKAYSLQPLHDYFLYVRSRIIFQSVATREPTFLDSEEWKTIPWSRHPETKTSHHLLMDIVAALAGVYYDVDRLFRNGKASHDTISPEEEPVLRQSLRARIVRSMRDLIKWRYDWEVINPEVVSETDIAPTNKITVKLDRPKCLSTVFYYNSPSQVADILLYNAGMLCFTYTITRLHDPSMFTDIFRGRSLQTRPSPQNALQLPNQEHDILDYAREIIRSLEYCIISQKSRLGVAGTMMPAIRAAIVACQLKSSEELEVSFLSGVLEGLATELGFDVCRRLIDPPPLGFYVPTTTTSTQPGDGSYAFLDNSNHFLPIREQDVGD